MKKFKSTKQKKELPVERVEWCDFNEVNLWEANPRKNQKSVRDLALLFAQYGQRTPLSVWVDDCVIYKGNTSYKSLVLLRDMSPAQFKKFTKGIKHPYKPEKVLIAWMNFEDEEQAIAYGISDNKSSEWSDWDDHLLAKLTQETFKGVDKKYAMRITGLKEREFNELMLSETDLPDKLPLVDLKGDANTLKADYLVVEMPDKKTRLQFMEAIGVDHFRNRVIKLDNLRPALSPEFEERMEDIDVGEVDYKPQKRNKASGKKKFKFKMKRK